MRIDLEERIQAFYDEVPDHIKDDISEAIPWAKETLPDGSDFMFCISAGPVGKVVCTFARPSWSDDFCGRPMNHGADAIVIAVCEYVTSLADVIQFVPRGNANEVQNSQKQSD
jgi:hypothetical protein